MPILRLLFSILATMAGSSSPCTMALWAACLQNGTRTAHHVQTSCDACAGANQSQLRHAGCSAAQVQAWCASVPKTLDTFTFMQTGTMQEADLVHGWTTAFSPPVQSARPAGPKGSPVYWEGVGLMNAVYAKYNVPGCYTEIPDCGTMEGCKGIFERQKYPYSKSGMNVNWEANLADLIQALKPFVRNGTITGIFIGNDYRRGRCCHST